MCIDKNIQFSYKLGNGDSFGAVLCGEDVIFTIPVNDKITKLCLYNKDRTLIDSINVNAFKVSDNLASVIVKGLKEKEIYYHYEVEGKVIPDIFIKDTVSKRTFREINNNPLESKVYSSDYDWEDDSLLNLNMNDVIAYQLHVRGFTAHNSSKVKARGKYAGIIEKIPYLKDLGVNQVVLMPTYEFYEYDNNKKASYEYVDYTKVLDSESKDKPILNYWGFKEGSYFMPKVAYSAQNPVVEFKDMVKKLHKNGIEVVMRFYFPDTYNKSFIADILKFWKREYHIDGFFLMGNDIPMEVIAADLYLRDVKLYHVFFDKNDIVEKSYGYNRKIAFCNNDFSICMRKYLKSDEDMLSDFTHKQRLNPSDIHRLNYVTDYEGFTLNDLVSYDYKHNEGNLEDNKDGENYNYSWNCGCEGFTRKKSISLLRIKQIKNAFTFLLLAQGTPMLLAGDEMLNSQNGNNNAYCQDNEVGWVVWKDNSVANEVRDFVKDLIKLRKEHPVLRPASEYRIMDYAACGYPDLSYHGEAAWAPRFDNHLRHIGFMICGKYARIDRLNEDDFFYIAYNMHWESHTFGLPKLPKGLKWSNIITTGNDNDALLYFDETNGGDNITVSGRSIAIISSAKVKVDK